MTPIDPMLPKRLRNGRSIYSRDAFQKHVNEAADIVEALLILQGKQDEVALTEPVKEKGRAPRWHDSHAATSWGPNEERPYEVAVQEELENLRDQLGVDDEHHNLPTTMMLARDRLRSARLDHLERFGDGIWSLLAGIIIGAGGAIAASFW